MRGIVLACVGGCGFSVAPGAGGEPDAPRGIDSPAVIDAAGDAPTLDSPPMPGLCGGKVWFADFSTDPTTFDNTGDGIDDWAMRDDSPFPIGELVAGEWSTPSASPQPLDTRPAQTFTTRTIIDVRMRSTTTSGARGAVFWINFGFDGTGYVALFVDVKRSSGTAQRIELVNKVGATEDVFASATGLSLAAVDIQLDLDPSVPSVTYSAGGTSGTRMLGRTTSTVAASWATLTAYSGAAAFDQVRVEVCP